MEYRAVLNKRQLDIGIGLKTLVEFRTVLKSPVKHLAMLNIASQTSHCSRKRQLDISLCLTSPVEHRTAIGSLFGAI